MVPGSSQRLKLPLPADLSMTDQTDDDMDDERFILAAKRARSASMKEGMYEERATPPSLLAQLSQNTPPSSLELSLMLAQARAAQERAAQEHVRRQLQDQSPGSPPGLPPGLPMGAAGNASSPVLAVTPPIQHTQQRSRKNRDPKRLNPSASPSEEELPQSEPEDLSSKKPMPVDQEGVNLDLLAITTSEAVLAATNPTKPTAPTLSQMPIANK